MKFRSFALPETLLTALDTLQYLEATPIQEATLAKILKGKSLVCKSETGSGKTHAFLIPIVAMLDANIQKMQALILVPTQELVLQCASFARALAQEMGTFQVKVFTSLKQKEEVAKKEDVLPSIGIGTIGRVQDVLLKEKTVDRKMIRFLVLDEADMLFETSYAAETIQVIQNINAKQTLLFTATMKEHELAHLKQAIHASEVIDVDRKVFSNRNIVHHLIDIKHRSFKEALLLYLSHEQPYFTLVFASSKKTIESLVEELHEEGLSFLSLTASMSSRERKNVLKRLQLGEVKLLLATDVAARGLDLPDVSHVISLDLPNDLSYYYHRAGRTGRMGKRGESIIFYDDDHRQKVDALRKSMLPLTYSILRAEGVKDDKKKIPQKRKVNETLRKEIHKELAKVRKTEVKPGYKKKQKRAIEKAVKNHKREIIRKNLREKKRKETL